VSLAFSPDQLMSDAQAIPIPHDSALAPQLCPTCGAPVSGRLMVTHIQALVAAYYKIPVREMTSERRHRAVARPRQVAMYFCYELTPKSFPDIGRRFGNRDHTTVIHAVRTVQSLLLTDLSIEADVKALRERLAA
jgi:chromosomal replication initiator protein